MDEDIFMEEDLLRAIREGAVGSVQRLLMADPTLEERAERHGILFLALAARYGQLEVVQMLLQRMGERGLETRDWEGGTALHYAAKKGYEGVVALLLKHGAQANSRDDYNYTPLIYASAYGHLGVVKLLVQHMGGRGLDETDDDEDDEVVYEDQEGNTALHCAAFWGHDQVVRLLLLAGADPTIMDNEGKTPRTSVEEQMRGALVLDDSQAKCVALFEWWDGEIERRALLYRATCLHKAFTTQRDMPTSQVPNYLEARVAAGHAVPVVEVVSPQSERRVTRSMIQMIGASGKSKAADEQDDTGGAEAGEEERHAMVAYVVNGLNEALLIELLEGFHGPFCS